MEPLLILALLVFAFLTYRYSKILVRKDISAANKRLAIVFYLLDGYQYSKRHGLEASSNEIDPQP